MIQKAARNKGYKETEIGTIPAEWSVVSLSEVATFSRKPRGLQLSEFDMIPFYPMEVLPENGIGAKAFEPREPNDIRSGTYFEKGDILLAKITPSFENGKQAFINDIPTPFAYATTEVYAFHPTSSAVVDQMFLFYYFKLRSVRVDMAGKMEGSTGRQRIPKAVIENYPVPLPPLDEQKHIAAVLSTIQQAIEKQEQVIQAARELKRSLMHRLFTYGSYTEPAPTKETEFGDVPANWKRKKLKECAFVQTGAAKGRNFNNSPTMMVPYLRVANVQDGYLDLEEIKKIRIKKTELDRYRLQEGDVVLTEGGDFDKLGRGFIWRGQIEPCIHQNHVFAVRANQEVLLPEFLAYLVQSDYGKRYFLKVAHRTTNLASINSTKLKAFPLLLPSLEEQAEVVRHLQKTDKKIAKEESRKNALEALFKSMLHQLMTGQIRVPTTGKTV